MAKALLGHLGNADLRAVAEVQRLRRRVRELESQVLRMQAENDRLQASASGDALLSLEHEGSKEPALA